MLSFHGPSPRLCDGFTCREVLRVGGLSALGLSLPGLLRARTASAARPARPARRRTALSCFCWAAPHNIRRGIRSRMRRPRFAASSGRPTPTSQASAFARFCRVWPVRPISFACSAPFRRGTTAHSSSGYYMLTGVPHAPLNVENANPGVPNDWPCLGGLVRRLRGDRGGLPGAVRLPMHIYNTDGSVWPGQDAGFLGRSSDPWLFRCDPAHRTCAFPSLLSRPMFPPIA